ncbi:MAG: DarT ssDNA thymidine ADP-ribosyltransferase family protein [Candidatus Poribacteria bacterium]|nr:DarT ssDNA thymidine ADP-ribosyltransferase family protein [Candidatus Poribacteria bacterium]
MRNSEIKALYYITHIDNLPSIFEKGILSHERIEKNHVQPERIYNTEIVNIRKEKRTPNQKSLWSYANLYFQPRNPMMYRVVHEKGVRDLAVLEVSENILQTPGIFITDGNAANAPTQVYPLIDGLKVLRRQRKILYNEWWNTLDGSKRKIMAECLVPDSIRPEFINSVYVADEETRRNVSEKIGSRSISVIPEPNMFFQPNRRNRIGENISLIDGDMFFSTLQTLTISVNLQGVMGKGLASRAKYQFPDVYVAYQDVCRSKRVTATKPYLYKREGSLDEELADHGSELRTLNAVKWFLLFATKRKWRENSRLEDIEGGLDWVQRNFQKEGIESLAMPALGCGLGGLDWKDVGPLMCKSLHGIGISVAIYLPRERKIPQQYLTESHLLAH